MSLEVDEYRPVEQNLPHTFNRRKALEFGVKAAESAAMLYIFGKITSGTQVIKTPGIDLPEPLPNIPNLHPTENQKTFRPIRDIKLDVDSEVFIGHRVGNTGENMTAAAEAGIKWVDLDLIKTNGIRGGIYVGHQWVGCIPFLGIPIIEYDRASSRFGWLTSPEKLNNQLKLAKKLGVKVFAELKRGDFNGQDVVNIRKMANDSEVQIILQSADYNIVEEASYYTHDRGAVLFRPNSNNSDALESAINQGYGVFTDYNTAMREKDRLATYDGVIVVGGITNRDQVSILKNLGIKVTAFFDNAPAIAMLFGQTVTP